VREASWRSWWFKLISTTETTKPSAPSSTTVMPAMAGLRCCAPGHHEFLFDELRGVVLSPLHTLQTKSFVMAGRTAVRTGHPGIMGIALAASRLRAKS
jgi:hypothetical protein